MRFENKHTFFTNAAHSTKNFVNIVKTIANENQGPFAYKLFVTDKIEFSKRFSNFLSSDWYDEYIETIYIFVDEILLFAKYNQTILCMTSFKKIPSKDNFYFSVHVI